MMTSAIAPPHTYADWVTVLNILQERTDDEAVLAAMKQGTLEWQTGVADRFSQKLIGVINARINGANDRFQREQSRSHGQERVIVQALINLRRELCFLAQAIDLPVIPEPYRSQYRQLVIDQANRMQSALEDSAKGDRTGRQLRIVRSTRVNSF